MGGNVRIAVVLVAVVVQMVLIKWVRGKRGSTDGEREEVVVISGVRAYQVTSRYTTPH